MPLGLSNKKVKGGTDLVYVARRQPTTSTCSRATRPSSTATTSPAALADAGRRAGRRQAQVGQGLVAGLRRARDRLLRPQGQVPRAVRLRHRDRRPGARLLPGCRCSAARPARARRSKDGGDAAFIDGSLYALKGGNTQDFYSLDLATLTWGEKETIPAFGTTGKKKRVKGGGEHSPPTAPCCTRRRATRRWRSGGTSPAWPRRRLDADCETRMTGRGQIGCNRRVQIARNPAVGTATIRWSAPSTLAPSSTLSSVRCFRPPRLPPFDRQSTFVIRHSPVPRRLPRARGHGGRDRDAEAPRGPLKASTAPAGGAQRAAGPLFGNGTRPGPVKPAAP